MKKFNAEELIEYIYNFINKHNFDEIKKEYNSVSFSYKKFVYNILFDELNKNIITFSLKYIDGIDINFKSDLYFVSDINILEKYLNNIKKYQPKIYTIHNLKKILENN